MKRILFDQFLYISKFKGSYLYTNVLSLMTYLPLGVVETDVGFGVTGRVVSQSSEITLYFFYFITQI